ncbi:hypothetical protein [Vibrio vulnificus]|uniref:hypothetical protein n=1 Tax=Vibrio vulnificus TaxID=672 RepID=UPI0028797052|nr:hypothetical protein [Vibrio vulnificus]MDS1873215.1 hypothetical protein [Vibrio vulnificus]
MAIDNIELNTTDTPPRDSSIKIGPNKKFQNNKRHTEAANENIVTFKGEKRLFEVPVITIQKTARYNRI